MRIRDIVGSFKNDKVEALATTIYMIRNTFRQPGQKIGTMKSPRTVQV